MNWEEQLPLPGTDQTIHWPFAPIGPVLATGPAWPLAPEEPAFLHLVFLLLVSK